MADPLDNVSDDKRAEAIRLDAIFRDVTGWQPKLWRNVIGYGEYHYRTKSDLEGDFLATGFNMRARDISLHILPGYSDFPDIADRLGPHKRGRSCWYVKSLDGVNEAALRDLIRAGLKDLAEFADIKGT